MFRSDSCLCRRPTLRRSFALMGSFDVGVPELVLSRPSRRSSSAIRHSAAAAVPAPPPAPPAAPRSRYLSPGPRPPAGPATHAAPPNRRTDQAHRARAPIVLNVNGRLKHPLRRAASAPGARTAPNGGEIATAAALRSACSWIRVRALLTERVCWVYIAAPVCSSSGTSGWRVTSWRGCIRCPISNRPVQFLTDQGLVGSPGQFGGSGGVLAGVRCAPMSEFSFSASFASFREEISSEIGRRWQEWHTSRGGHLLSLDCCSR
jgi:hypothetical protein